MQSVPCRGELPVRLGQRRVWRDIDGADTPMIRTVLYRNFAEDRRVSMDGYADSLSKALRILNGDRRCIREYCPTIPRWVRWLPDRFNARMRAARYIAYPLQVRSEYGVVNHIVEDGYAHLACRLDETRTIVTVADVMPLLAWKGMIPGLKYPHRPILYEYSLRSLRRVAHIIAVSESTKRDLVKHCGCSDERITVIYPGVGSTFRPVSSDEKRALRRRFSLPGEDTQCVLITGYQAYKNHGTCLRVIERVQELCKGPVQLVRLGRINTEWKNAIEGAKLRHRPIIIEELTLSGVGELYRSVDCLLFPSLYEGLGRPPIEAMASGIPVVASNQASLPEVIGDAGLMCEPNDVDGLSKAVYEVLSNSALRSVLLYRGYRNAARFTWLENARRTRDLYRRLLSEKDMLAR